MQRDARATRHRRAGDHGTLGHPGIRGFMAVGIAALASGCMWVASPRCLLDRPDQPPVAVIQMLLGRRWLPEEETSDWRASETLTLYRDGYLRYDNGQYPWCRRLGPEEMRRLRRGVETLRALAGPEDELWKAIRSEGFRSPMVAVLFPEADEAHAKEQTRYVLWSPLAADPVSRAEALDELFCTLETVMGHGFRYAVSHHFQSFLEDRARTRPCTE